MVPVAGEADTAVPGNVAHITAVGGHAGGVTELVQVHPARWSPLREGFS